MKNKAKKTGGGDRKFSDAFKRQVVQEFYSGKELARELAERYDLHGAKTVHHWANDLKSKGEDFSHLPGPKSELERKTERSAEERIKSLERQLEDERLKTLGLETMIDIAEKELRIQIRKKSGTKQSKP